MTNHQRRMKRPKLIVALDVATGYEAISLCESLLPDVDFFKVGLRLFCAEGPRVINDIKSLGGLVFLDLKFHDIPAQVKQAAGVIGSYGVDMATVHCLGGPEMLAAAKAGFREGAQSVGTEPPLVVGVTILTSLEPDDLEAVGVDSQIEIEVGVLAGLAKDAGLDGVVASPREVVGIKSEFTGDFLIVTPGIRPSWAPPAADQKRVMTPAEAVAAGASYIVVGRPITAATDPREAALKVLGEMGL